MAGAIKHFTTGIIDFQEEQEEHNRSIYVLVLPSPVISGSARDRRAPIYLAPCPFPVLRWHARLLPHVNRVTAEQVVSLESGARFSSVNRGNSSLREDPGTESAGGLRYITRVSLC
jgi:hypothetical protein